MAGSSNIGSATNPATCGIHSPVPAAITCSKLYHAGIPRLYRVKEHADRGDVTVAVPPGYAPSGGVVIATQEAQDLVAYLKSLKQVPLKDAGSR